MAPVTATPPPDTGTESVVESGPVMTRSAMRSVRPAGSASFRAAVAARSYLRECQAFRHEIVRHFIGAVDEAGFASFFTLPSPVVQ